jgi:hypothetical protein
MMQKSYRKTWFAAPTRRFRMKRPGPTRTKKVAWAFRPGSQTVKEAQIKAVVQNQVDNGQVKVLDYFRPIVVVKG